MNPANDRKSQLRLWPGVIAVVLQWIAWEIVPLFNADMVLYSVMGTAALGIVILIWWLAFSKAPHLERWSALALLVALAFAAVPVLDPSIRGGMMSMMYPMYSFPLLSLALVGWAVVSRRFSGVARYAALAATVALACGSLLAVRTNGITAEGRSDLKWRWARTAEQRLIAQTAEMPAPAAQPPPETPAPAAEIPARPAALHTAVPTNVPAVRLPGDWPGFRGPNRDDHVNGLRIKTDWTAAPPSEMWRHPVGPGWSSFAVRDGLVYTQEQRGEFEVVSCYNLATGQPVWIHRDHTRFYESNGGAGPRGTPTLHEGRVYTFGATGTVDALDAKTGAIIWTRNASTDTGAKMPEWGFASSPLVYKDSVIVAASGRVVAYDLAKGDPRWRAQLGGGSYASPQFLNINGVDQIVVLTGLGLAGLAPADGSVLWKYSWEGFASLQPAIISDGNILIASADSGGGLGTRRLAITQSSGDWKASEVWLSKGLKPYFNDLVIHNGNAYGFDGGILSCIDLQDGSRKWKGGRYGHGQLLLLADQDLLLVTSEEGEVALVAATPAQFSEIAKIRAMDGKTWNHPVVAGETLLIRNSEEMVAYRLPKL